MEIPGFFLLHSMKFITDICHVTMMHMVLFFHKQVGLPDRFFPHSIAQLVRLALFCLCFSHEKFPNVHCAGVFHCGEGEGENHHNGSIGIKDKGRLQ